jgi:hypothetical protein
MDSVRHFLDRDRPERLLGSRVPLRVRGVDEGVWPMRAVTGWGTPRFTGNSISPWKIGERYLSSRGRDALSDSTHQVKLTLAP